MRREEGLEIEKRLKYTRLKCDLEKGSDRQAALAKKWEGLNRARSTWWCSPTSWRSSTPALTSIGAGCPVALDDHAVRSRVQTYKRRYYFWQIAESTSCFTSSYHQTCLGMEEDCLKAYWGLQLQKEAELRNATGLDRLLKIQVSRVRKRFCKICAEFSVRQPFVHTSRHK